MEFRSSLQYPPATALINVFVKGKSLERAMADALELRPSSAGSRRTAA